MKTIRTIWCKLRSLGQRPAVKREIDEELRFHLEQRTAENLAAGMPPEQAAREARKRFGNWQSVREDCRDLCGASLGETTWQDVRFGWRMLRKNPGFALIAVLSLALGIGANTAIFSLINAVLLRSLPVRNPSELRVVNWAGHNISVSNFEGNHTKTHGGGWMSGSFSYPLYCDFRDRVEGFSSVFALANLMDLTAIGPDGASTSQGLLVSGNYFAGYGATTLIGRPIVPEDDRPEAEPVVVITYRWWERHGGLDPNILGHTVTLNKTTFTIIGVLPRDHLGPIAGDMADFYVPLSAQAKVSGKHPLESRDHWWLQIMARLAPGADESQVRSAMEVIFRRSLSAPEVSTKMDRPVIVLQAGRSGVLMERQKMALPLFALLAVVGLVLLIACANLASLLLSRAAARQHEFAVRAAIGASRWRLIRQSLTENLLLAFAGGALGMLLTVWLRSALPPVVARFDDNFRLDLVTDGRVLAFTIGVSNLTALLSGFIPASRAARVDPAAGLQSRRTDGAPPLRLGKVLVSAQVGLSLLLLVGATLLGRTFANLRQVNPGFATENLLVFELNASQGGYSGDMAIAFYDRVIERISAIPGVREIGLSSPGLLCGSVASTGISIPGRQSVAGEPMQANQMAVNEWFFLALRIPLLRGRSFAGGDTATSPKVAVVNQRFAHEFLNDSDAIGQTFKVGSETYAIIGVCANAKYNSLRAAIAPTMYFSVRQAQPRSVFFEVRSILPPLSLAPAVRKVVTACDVSVPMAHVSTQEALFERSLLLDKLLASLCGGFALLALLLSCLGVYGLMAYTVARRTREFGIRMALGATREGIARPVIGEALIMAGWGIVLGLPAALALSALMRGILFGIEPFDPATMVGVVSLVLGIAALAAWIPAHRAARIHPMEALRSE